MKKILIVTAALISTLAMSAQTYKGATQKQTVEQRLNDEYCTGLFNSTEGTILDIASNTSTKGYTNILDWLPGRVAGMQVFTTRTGVTIPIIRGTVPGIYIDEMPVSVSFLNALNVNDIAMIKVIKTPFYGGFNGGGGAIAIYTLRGEEDEEEVD